MAMAITALSHLAAADAMRTGASASAAAVPVALPMQRSSAAASTSGSCFGSRLEDLRLPATTRRSSRRGSKRWQVLPTAEAGRSGNAGHHDRPCTPLLDGIHCPAHLKNLSSRELSQLSDELRSEAIFSLQAPAAGGDGGDLDSSLGVVELTVALHHVFNAPRDRIVWDAGNQAVPHKLLTGRRRRASGLLSRAESEYDAFGASHSAVAVSAALGMAVGRDLKGRDNHVVSVIGDGAMTTGQAFEAMSNAGYLEANMIVILNDSRRDEPTHASSPPSSPSSSCCSGDGPICPALSRLQASKPLRELREVAKNVTKQLSGTVHEIAARVDEVARGLIGGHASSLFDGLGVYYIGPVDGHNIQHLVTILNEVKSTQSDGPVLIHIVTEKGRGRPHPAAAGVMLSSFGFEEEPSCAVTRSSYSERFADALVAEAEQDDDIVAVHAGMGRETGMDVFGERFPERCFDVGMAEQHAVTFAAGLACEGLKPFCAIPSSFLQRAYDQVVHDVDLQRLPVRFAIGGAGLNGAAAAGTFDVTYMACLSNMVVMAPSDEAELARMVATAAAIDDRPSCFRFPSGYTGGVGVAAGRPKGVPLEAVGRGRVLVEGTQVALLGYGATVRSCLAAQAMLAERHGVSVTVADARFCKPLDRDLIRKLAGEHQALLTVEEGAIGGFGSHVAQFMALDGLLDGNLKWRPLVLPDYHINHGAHEDQLAQAGLTVAHIAATVLTLLGKKKEALQIF